MTSQAQSVTNLIGMGSAAGVERSMAMLASAAMMGTPRR